MAGTQHLVNLRVPRIVKELQAPQQCEFFLLIDARRLFRRVWCTRVSSAAKFQPRLIARRRILCIATATTFSISSGHVAAQVWIGAGVGIDDLMQQLGQVAGAKWPHPGQQLYITAPREYRSERLLSSRLCTCFRADMGSWASRDALRYAISPSRDQRNAEIDDSDIAVGRSA